MVTGQLDLMTASLDLTQADAPLRPAVTADSGSKRGTCFEHRSQTPQTCGKPLSHCLIPFSSDSHFSESPFCPSRVAIRRMDSVMHQQRWNHAPCSFEGNDLQTPAAERSHPNKNTESVIVVSLGSSITSSRAA